MSKINKVACVLFISFVVFSISIDVFSTSSSPNKTYAFEYVDSITYEEQQSISNSKKISHTAQNVKNQKYSISKKGEDFIKRNENCFLKAYWDVNGYSIGYGHHTNVKKNDVITQKQADKYFSEDINNINAAVNRLAKDIPFDNLSQDFIDGLCDMIYNCGEAGVRNTKFYKSLTQCRRNNKSDFVYCIAMVKNTKITAPGHKERRYNTHKLMLS